MARTNIAAVKLILDTKLTDPQLQAFVDDASLWVTTHLGSAGLGADLLKSLEKWLAAHFATAREPRLKSQRHGDDGEVYQRDLYVSEYLRQAVGLDPTGIVEDRLSPEGKQKVSFRASEGHDTTLDLPGKST